MNKLFRLLGILFALALELLIPLSAHAQWIEGDSISICIAPGNQTSVTSVSDGHGGVITAWLDCRNGCYEIYAQRIDSLGYARWGIDGVLAAGQSPDKTNLVIVGDGAGGAIIAWVDRTQDRTGAMSLNVYAQKIDALGNLTAALTGKPICTAENDQRGLCMVPDGSGGAIAAWTDHRRFNPAYPHYGASDVYGEHIDHDGNMTWGSTRLVLGDREASLNSLVSDGRAGAILSYEMRWPGSYLYYMARISSGGGSLWTLELTGDQVISNGAGGAIVTWISADSTRGQWIDSAGVSHWGSGGKTILPGMIRSDGVPDGKGGAIFMAPGIVQRIDSNGERLWSPPEGVNIEVDGPLIADGFGGAIVGTTAVQRVDSFGNVVWRPGGEPTVAGSVTHLVSDGAGGVILVFGSEDIYAQRVNPATRSPILAAIGDRSLEVGETVVIQLSATDPNPGDVLVFSTSAASILPTAFEFDISAGLFSWTPQSGEEGDYFVTFGVTDGIFTDLETIRISVFNNGDRPPVLQPIDDIIVCAGSIVVITAVAVDPDGDEIAYSISDPRFTQADNIFSWQTEDSDTGTYSFLVTASDGFLSRGTPVQVTVIGCPPANADHDPMKGDPTSPFAWRTHDAFWSGALYGYLYGANGSWTSAAVSERAFNASGDPFIVVRLEFSEGQTNYIFGFTSISPDETDFNSSKVALGLYVHSSGSIRPSWSTSSTLWTLPITQGVIDVRIALISGEGKVRFDVQQVARWEVPVATFDNPDWSYEVSRPLAPEYYIQINPYNSSARVFDVWARPENLGGPVLSAIGDRRADVGTELSIQLAASDPDSGDALTYGTNAESVLPSAISFDANTGLFSWTPVSGDAGDYSVTFSVTDGIFEDSETIVISVFEDDTRPPVIEPIDDVTVIADMTVVIEAHASDPDGDDLTFSISDARFTQNDSIFSWQTTTADTGTYHFIVSVTDGHLSDSVTVTVRVLEQSPYYSFYDPMTGVPGSPFHWSENGVLWHPVELGGYLSGTTPAAWSQAVVSGLAIDAAVDSQVVFRLQFIQGATNYILGFTATPPSSTNFDRTKVNLGLYLHLDGTLGPSWMISTTPWTYTVTSGVYDVRITLHQGRQTVGFDLQRVASYADPLSAFSSPDWSGELPALVGSTNYVQINPYSDAAKVYDVWLGASCGGLALQPIDDVLVWEDDYAMQQPVLIEPHATCGCGCAVRYWMNDPRFVQCSDSVFCWIMATGDAGEYHPVVYAAGGISVDSVTVNVTVLRTCVGCVVRGYSSSMAAETAGSLAWHERAVTWNPEENGYLSGRMPAGWYSGVVSGTSFATTPKRSVIVRFLRSSATNIKAGFTFTPPRANDFDSRKIDCGVYVDSTGSVRPTGPADNPDVWKTGLHEGIYDLKIEIDPSTSTVKRSLVRVPRFDDLIPDFSTVVWSVQETAAIADSCWIQINPYNEAAKIYNVFSSPLIWVEVLSSSSAMDKDAVIVTWTLADRSSDVQFFVSREENDDGVFDELPGIPIEKDSLTYTFSDNTCRPNTSYRYMVEANYPTGRAVLFYQSIKTPPLPLGLLQNHPNPFASLTTIGYDVPGEDHVTIDVYNVLGQHVARLVNAREAGGRHTIVWNGNDKNGRPLSSGIYFYRIEWAGQTLSRKMILLK